MVEFSHKRLLARVYSKYSAFSKHKVTFHDTDYMDQQVSNPCYNFFFLAENMFDVTNQAKRDLIVVQKWQTYYDDEKRREVSYEIGQQVLVSITNIKLKAQGDRKLLPW